MKLEEWQVKLKEWKDCMTSSRVSDIGFMADGTQYVRSRMSEIFPDGSLVYPLMVMSMMAFMLPWIPIAACMTFVRNEIDDTMNLGSPPQPLDEEELPQFEEFSSLPLTSDEPSVHWIARARGRAPLARGPAER